MKKFYLGMDIGTDSVGMACTDEQYRLLRARGKDLWSVRLFNEANTAADRRVKRTARRRLARRAQRIDFLQEIFTPFLEDEYFFLRLNNSGFCFEDKAEGLNSKYSLFADDGFDDRRFHALYPTVYHLRSELAAGTEKKDLRLYYLALHHIVKYRGHFLSEGNLTDIRDATGLFAAYNATVSEMYGDDAYLLDEARAAEFKKIALDRNRGVKDKKRACETLFGATTRQGKEIISLILGGTAKPAEIFGNEAYKEQSSLSFPKLSDEAFDALAAEYGDDFAPLQALRAIYNYTLFEKILDGNTRISDAMIAIYHRHAKDLAQLKKFVKKYCAQGVYYQLFRSASESANYASYIGYTKIKNKKQPTENHCKYEEFCKYLEKTLKAVDPERLDESGKAERDKLLAAAKNQTFLPKILHADNGIFPHQVNESELTEIVDNLVRDYPAFGKIGADGLSAADKIRKTFAFRIPYYVGPLNTAHTDAGHSWAVREKGRITPWNFDDMVDKEASNERFIRRMTRKCSYLYGKDVLPKCSLVYQKFDVLNQLNKLKINEKPISVPLKQELYRTLFLRYPRVTDKKIREYLARTGQMSQEEARAASISGKDGDSLPGMSSYITLKKILGDAVNRYPEMCEDIILWHTMNTDKSIVERQIRKKYGNNVEIRDKIKQIKGITSFKDFGRLSREFLTELAGGVDDVTGEIYTVLRELYETNLNLNEILNGEKYSFLAAIEEANGGQSAEVTYRDVEEMYLPPQVRRGVWQALRMADEYISTVGRAPDKVFIEVTRQEDKKKERTVSRKNQLNELLAAARDCCGIEHLMEELRSPEMTDLRLRSERLYLYFKQLGRCVYSGEVIRLDQLNTDLYDVDHILPRSIMKDDSLENKVLVLREKNMEKRDNYPLPDGFTNMQEFWRILRAKKLMSDKKYALLTRTDPLTEADYAGFINRQIVVTSQTAKAVCELMKRKYGASGTRIVYSKAKNVNDFKNKYQFFKCRETNDLHHARDAYLNIVVGNVFDTMFSSPYAYRYPKGDGWRQTNPENLFDRDRSDVWAWERDMETVCKTYRRTSMTVTRYSFVQKGEFYNQTVYGKDDSSVRVPRKWQYPYAEKNADGYYKYGGYSSLDTAYFSIVSSTDKKGKRIKTIEAIPVLYHYQIKGNPEALLEYFEKTAGLKDPEIIVPKVKIKALLEINGFPVQIAGMTGNRILLHNAVQWFTDGATDRYVSALVKLSEDARLGKLPESERAKESFVMNTNRFGEKSLVVDRAHNVELFDAVLVQLAKPVYQGISGAVNFRETLAARREKFLSLGVWEQVTVLLNITKFMRHDVNGADLSLLGEGKGCGKLTVNSNITKIKIRLIDESPCGLISRTRTV